jgi:YHS domain-containing protein
MLTIPTPAAEPAPQEFVAPKIAGPAPTEAAREQGWSPTRRAPVPETNIAAPSNPPAIAPPKTLDPEPAAELPAATANDHQRKLRLIAERRGQPGFKGFCPVILRDSRDLVDASQDFQSNFEGVIYTFSSAEAKARFDQNPGRYAPAAGGNDVILLGNFGREVPGSLEYAVWYKDRLHLFSTKDSLESFLETLGSMKK